MKASGSITKLMDLVLIFGKMGENTMAHGSTTICRAMEFISMQMVYAMMDNTIMIRKKVLVCTSGLMAVNMRAGGTKASSMVLELTSIVQNNQ